MAYDSKCKSRLQDCQEKVITFNERLQVVVTDEYESEMKMSYLKLLLERKTQYYYSEGGAHVL
jgi:hypothetical protein